jgi:hypothetical protein
VYSLVTPSVLVTDVACRAAGGHLLRLLDEVLLLDRAALPALCDALLRCDLDALVAARRAARLATEQAPTYDDVVLALQAGTDADVDGVAARLARVPAGGGLPALLDLVAEQALPPADPDLPTLDEQAAQSAVGDALAEGWHAGGLDPAHRAVLRGPWLSARRSAPRWLRDRVGVLGPHADGVRASCARVRRHGPEVLGGLAAAHGRTDGWAAQMHEAAWAAYLSDRLRAVAHAQVQAAGALLAAAGPAPDPVLVRCALPAVLGAITASALQDVLPDDVAGGLRAAWAAVDGA